jgi:hypothetical protein
MLEGSKEGISLTVQQHLAEQKNRLARTEEFG